MRIHPLLITLATFAGLAIAVPSRAQNPQPAPAPAPAATPAATPANDATSAPDQLAAKKVWTNDDFGSNGAAAPGAASSAKAKPARPGVKPAQGKNAGWYHSQIAKMNAQVADIDAKIASYQAALNGEPLPAQGQQQYHMRAADWHAEIQKLTLQKQDLNTKISALEDEARHSGIDPSKLH
jgi:hypothetical protein